MSRQGMFIAAGLPKNSPDKVYELWAIAGDEPVPAGVFAVSEKPQTLLRLPPLPEGKTFDKFAVTLTRRRRTQAHRADAATGKNLNPARFVIRSRIVSIALSQKAPATITENPLSIKEDFTGPLRQTFSPSRAIDKPPPFVEE